MGAQFKAFVMTISFFSSATHGYIRDRSPDFIHKMDTDGEMVESAIGKRKLLAQSADDDLIELRIEALKSETARLLSVTNTNSLIGEIPNIHSYLASELRTIDGFIAEISSIRANNGTLFNSSAESQASQIISIIEDLGAITLRLINTPEYSLTVGNIDMFIMKKSASNFNGFVYNSKGEGEAASISVPAEAKRETMAGVVGFTVQNLQGMFSSRTYGSVVTPVASCTVLDARGRPIHLTTLDPVTIDLGYSGIQPDKGKREVAVCSFIKMENNGEFRGWSEEQCDLVSQSSDRIICRCTHLTAFAVLYRKEGLAEQLLILSWVGCAFTTLCCLITALTMVGYRLLDSTRSFVRMNFLMSLGMSEAIFLAGIRYTDVPALCMMVAGFLHFSVLSCFTWLFSYILLLGTEMRTTNPYRRTMTAGMYTVLGWVVPICIVAITMIARHHVYRDPYYCWISSSEFLNLSLLVPAGIILIMSWVILGYVVDMYYRMKGDTEQVSLLALTWSGIVSCTVISPLMTVTWFLGTFSVTFRAIWLQALFTLFNVTLGLTIFFFMCLLNSEVRMARRQRKVAPSSSVRTGNFTPKTIEVNIPVEGCDSEKCIHKSKCFYGQKVSRSSETTTQDSKVGLNKEYTWQAHERRRPGTAKLSDVLYRRNSTDPRAVPQRADSKTELLSSEEDRVGESSF